MAHVLLVDRFGNASLDVGHADLAGSGLSLGKAVEIDAEGGERFIATFAQTFADVRPGDVILYEDAYRMLAIAVNRGDAASALRLSPDVRGRAAAAMIGAPARTPSRHRLDERAREGAGAAGAPHGTLVTADEQTAGRGRQGRAWSAEPGDALLDIARTPVAR